MRVLVRAVRDNALLGQTAAGDVRAVLPAGILNGWQYAAALFMGLLVLGNYGPGDMRRDAKRLFWACALATALPLWMTVWTRGIQPVALQYALTTILVWIGLLTERQLLDAIINRVRPGQREALRTLFVGPAEACRETEASPAFAVESECRTDWLRRHPHPAGACGIGSYRRLRVGASGDECRGCCDLRLPDRRPFHDVVDAALTAGCKVLAVPRSIAIAGVAPQLVWRRDQALVELTTPTLRGGQLIIKRVMDLVGATVGLVLATPLLLHRRRAREVRLAGAGDLPPESVLAAAGDSSGSASSARWRRCR